MKKIYISLPMSGQEDTIWERYVKAENELKNKFGDTIEIKGPCNIRDFKEPENFEYDRDWCYYMAKDVEDLLRKKMNPLERFIYKGICLSMNDSK